MSDAVAASSRLISRTGFLLLMSAIILTLSSGIRQSFGLFLPPLAALGVTASAYSFAIALQAITWGASQPFVGMLADRWGSRPVLIVSGLIYAAGLLVMAAIFGPIGLDVGGGLMIGLGIAGTNLGILMGLVSRAVTPEKRSQAVGAIAAAGSLGTIALAPLAQWLIDGWDWCMALVTFAAVAGSMALFAVAMPKGEPVPSDVKAADEEERPLGEMLRIAARHPGYLAMTAAFFACGFQLMFINTHLPSYLVMCGMSPGLGATALGVIGLCNAIGTYVFGLLGARYSQKRLLALVYLLRTVFIIAFISLPVSPTTTLVFAAAMGFLWLSVAPLVSGLVGRVFGLKYFATLYGFVFLSHQVGSFAGVMLGGLTFDLTGTYETAWLALIAIGALAFALQWPMDDRTPDQRARGAARHKGWAVTPA
ncbi:MAG: MFS transporter [Alphaproteobacteria bacterium]|nr:MFS transporter [Alphaproteobacteria bacterium]